MGGMGGRGRMRGMLGDGFFFFSGIELGSSWHRELNLCVKGLGYGTVRTGRL